MPVKKAEIYELDSRGEPRSPGQPDVVVQFNPETLRVSYSNQIVPPTNASSAAGTGDQSNQASSQFVGRGSTRLSVQVTFDVTGEMPQSAQGQKDVRQLTRKVARFMQPLPSTTPNTPSAPPRLRFSWGSFSFDGTMDSLEETLEFFSTDGVPLRASMTFSLAQQEIQIAPERPPQPGGGVGGGLGIGAPGTTPLFQAQAGATLQGITASAGVSASWQSVASANGIENPRRLEPGQLIDVNAGASFSGSASASIR